MRLYEKLQNNEIYVIAEMSANHAGKIENAFKIIEEAAKAGADCVKIQTYTADTITIDCKEDPYIIKGGLWDGYNFYNLYQEAYTPWEWQKAIKEKCEEVGVAGGSSSSFRNVTELLDKRIEVVTVEYPGRGTRAKEEFAEDFETLIEDVADYINSRRDINLPYAVFGYSMGSIVTYELIANKRISGELKHVFLCAESSPMDKRDKQFGKNSSDESVISRLLELGGIDKRMLDNRRFFDIYVRPAVEDFKILKQHECLIKDTKLASPLTVIYSENDTPYDTIKGWADLVSERVEFYEMGDNHFFINQNYMKIAEVVNAKLFC